MLFRIVSMGSMIPAPKSETGFDIYESELDDDTVFERLQRGRVVKLKKRHDVDLARETIAERRIGREVWDEEKDA